MVRWIRLSGLATLAMILGGSRAPAQDIQAIINRNFALGEQANQQVLMLQAKLWQQYAQFWQANLRNPVFQEAWRKHRAEGGTLGYEQFVQWAVTTAGGTNYQGALDAQARQFDGWRRAAATQRQSITGQNQAWWSNTRRVEEAIENHSEKAIRATGTYRDPALGNIVKLPEGGQGFYSVGNQVFFRDLGGRCFRFNGSGWTPLDKAAR